MEEFIQKLHDALKTLKPFIVGIIGLVALIQLFIGVAVGNQDKRQTIINILGLLAFAALIMYSDKLFIWLGALFR
jgi:FtsH-binding integral membrane protein